MITINHKLFNDVCIIVVGGHPSQEAPVVPLGGLDILGVGPGAGLEESYNRPVPPFKQRIAQTTQRRPAVRGRASPFNVPMMIVLCVSERSYMSTSRRCFPFFWTASASSFTKRPLCFQGRDKPK